MAWRHITTQPIRQWYSLTFWMLRMKQRNLPHPLGRRSIIWYLRRARWSVWDSSDPICGNRTRKQVRRIQTAMRCVWEYVALSSLAEPFRLRTSWKTLYVPRWVQNSYSTINCFGTWSAWVWISFLPVLLLLAPVACRDARASLSTLPEFGVWWICRLPSSVIPERPSHGYEPGNAQ